MFLSALSLLAIDAPATSTPCANSFEAIETPEAHGKVIDLFASSRRPLVMVSIDGGPSLPFTFDTGSSGNLISMQVAMATDLPNTGPSPSVDGNGNPVPGFDTCLNNLTVGGVGGPDRRATAFPFDRTNEEGILSPMHFSGQVLKLDGPRSKLVVLERKPDTLLQHGVFPWAGSVGDAHPVIPISLAGTEVEVRLDSGSDADLILPMEWMAKLDLAEEPFVAGTMQTASVTTELYGAHLNGVMSVGPDMELDRPFLLFAETQTPLLGWPVMRSMVFYMDPQERVSWFEKPDE